jgi:hypothetical protein
MLGAQEDMPEALAASLDAGGVADPLDPAAALGAGPMVRERVTGGAATDAPPPPPVLIREVTGWDGPFEEAVEQGLVDVPPLFR